MSCSIKHWKSSIQESKPRFTSLFLMLRQSLNETHPSIQSIRFILDPEENFHIHNISLSPLVSRVMTAIIPIALWMNLFQVQYEKAVYGVINLISDIKYRKIFPSTKRKNDNLDWQTLNIMILLICPGWDLWKSQFVRFQTLRPRGELNDSSWLIISYCQITHKSVRLANQSGCDKH